MGGEGGPWVFLATRAGQAFGRRALSVVRTWCQIDVFHVDFVCMRLWGLLRRAGSRVLPSPPSHLRECDETRGKENDRRLHVGTRGGSTASAARRRLLVKVCLSSLQRERSVVQVDDARPEYFLFSYMLEVTFTKRYTRAGTFLYISGTRGTICLEPGAYTIS
jgi:hypothetical protein